MATTYTEARATLNEMADRVNAARRRAQQARNQYTVAQAELAGLPAAYATFVSDINAAATADDWPQADAQKAEKDQMVTEFNALKAEVEAIIAAIDAV
jgi:hypothetical protein